jgi:hypothetical protein
MVGVVKDLDRILEGCKDIHVLSDESDAKYLVLGLLIENEP